LFAQFFIVVHLMTLLADCFGITSICETWMFNPVIPRTLRALNSSSFQRFRIGFVVEFLITKKIAVFTC
jgi:hypothetical protein